jgi:hypothetical protein
MTDKLFDEFVKSKLEQHDSGAPMHVWERIKRDKDDNPKAIFFWWNKKHWILLGVLLIASSTGFLLLKKDVNPSVVLTAVESKTGSAAVIQESSNSNYSPVKEKTENTNKTKQTKTENTTAGTSQDANSKLIQSNDANQISGIEKKITSSSTVQKYKSETIGYSKPINNNSFVSKNISKKNVTTQNTFFVNGNFTNSQINNKQNVTVEQPQLSLAGYFQKSNFLQFKLGNIAMPQNKPSCPTINGPRRRDLYLEIYAGPDYNVRTLSTTSAPAGYVRERKENENYRTSFSAGVRLVKNLGEKTLIKTGINYTQINERLKLVAENSKQQTQIITIRTVIRAPGDTLFVRDTMYYEQNGTRYRTTYNRYRFIDVPVLFSYEFGNPDLMHFAVSAGAVINIASFYGGKVLDTTYQPLKISTNTGTNVNNWRNNIGVGVFASVAIYKKLNDRVHLFAEPYLRYNLNPVTQQNSIIKQRYLITGMQLGVRYNFIKPGQRYR